MDEATPLRRVGRNLADVNRLKAALFQNAVIATRVQALLFWEWVSLSTGGDDGWDELPESDTALQGVVAFWLQNYRGEFEDLG